MRNLFNKIKNKFKKSNWRVPDLSVSELELKNKSTNAMQNQIKFNKEDQHEKQAKKRTTWNKKSIGDIRKMTLKERMTPTPKTRRKNRKKLSGGGHFSSTKSGLRKILGPMGFTYIDETDHIIDEPVIKDPDSKIILPSKEKSMFFETDNNQEFTELSEEYEIIDHEKNSEVTVYQNSKWQPNNKGISIGRTVHYEMDSEIEEEFELEPSPSLDSDDEEKENIEEDETTFANNNNVGVISTELTDEEKEIKARENLVADSDPNETESEEEDYTEGHIGSEFENMMNENEEDSIENEAENLEMEYDEVDENEAEDLETEYDEVDENETMENDSHEEYIISEHDYQMNEVEDDEVRQRNTYENYELPPLDLLNDLLLNEYDDERIKEADIFTRQIEEVIEIMKLTLYIENRQIGSRVVKFQCPIDPREHNFKQNEEFMKRVKAMIGNENIRFQFPLYGKSNTFGIEVPFIDSQSILVQMKTAIRHLENSNKAHKLIIFPMGLDVNGGYPIGDLSELVHLLVAGYTGSGKSVFLQSIIATFLLRTNPANLKLVLIDPKQVEFTKYEQVPHLLTPIITNPINALLILEKMIAKMEKRYTSFRNKKVKDIVSYNETVSSEKAMPYIVIIIDELADLIMSAQDNRLESAIVRLAQKARAAGIHLIVSTQRPSTEVVTGLIKSNLPTRIAFALATGVDSRIILDENGAELLLGRGDLLIKAAGQNQVERLQGVFTSEEEIDRIVEWTTNQADPDFDEEFLNLHETQGSIGGTEGFEIKEKITRDHVIAADLILNAYENRKTVSISGLQRLLGIGHSKAARIVDALTANGILTEDKGNNKPREIIGSIEEIERIKEEWRKKL